MSDQCDGQQLIEELWRESWKPPDRRSAWEWGEEHVTRIPYSPIPGKFRSDNSPWIRKPLESLTDVTIRKVQIVAGIQASKTLLMEIGSCFITACLPGPLLWLDQKDEEAADELESRIKPLWNECAPVKRLVPGATGRNRYKNKRNKVTLLNGMTAHFLGAHNKKNLQRRSIRWLIGDENWSWPKGHMKEAEARVTAFGWLGKIFFSSQAGEEQDDTNKSFLSGTQEEWNFVCLNPECETLQPYLWENVEWSKDAKREDGTYDFDKVKASARIVCPHCEHAHDTEQIRVRNLMNNQDRGADYVVMNPDSPRDYRSYHWNSLCSVPVGNLVELYLQAKAAAKMGDMEDLKIFYQKRLALPWNELREDFKMEIERSNYLMGDPWAEEAVIWRDGTITDQIPDKPEAEDFNSDEEFRSALRKHVRQVGTPLHGRMMQVDCQRDHFWVGIFSFSETGDMRLQWCGGGRNKEEHDSDHPILFWEDLDDLAEEWNVPAHLCMVDAGYDTSRVYNECAVRGWTALMGDQRSTFQHMVPVNPRKQGGPKRKVERFYSPAKRVNLGDKFANVHFYSNLNVKDVLARLQKNQDPSEGPTFEVPDNCPEWYLKHMDSEKREKLPSGRYRWLQIGKRPNHGWDFTVMGVCALIMMKLLGKESVADGESVTEEKSE